ncbi:MAG: hypothetical protein V2A67_07285 [Bacteroidota bacterium]
MFRFLILCICSVLIGSGSLICAQEHHADQDSVKRWKQELNKNAIRNQRDTLSVWIGFISHITS